MTDIARLFDFVDGNVIYSADMDAELNQIINRIKDGAFPADGLAEALADLLGANQTGTVRRGKCIVATEQSRTNTAYGLLATPDVVEDVVLPADGLLVVAYHALWKESVANASAAAIFLGATELAISDGSGVAAPQIGTSSAAHFTAAAADRYTALSSYEKGLSTIDGTASSAESNVTTGQVIARSAVVGGDVKQGGICVIFAAAGTYDVSVQFKASSGSVTAKERKLWVKAEGFG